MENFKMDEVTKVETLSMIDLPTIDLQISCMTCSECAGRVEKALGAVYGVGLVSVNLANEKAHIEAKSGERLNPELLVSVATKAGYPATYINVKDNTEEQFRPSDRRQFLLLLMSILLTMPFMMQMILMPTSFDFNISPLTQLVLASLVQFVPGSRFYGPAWRAIKAKNCNMDVCSCFGYNYNLGAQHLLDLVKMAKFVCT